MLVVVPVKSDSALATDKNLGAVTGGISALAHRARIGGVCGGAGGWPAAPACVPAVRGVGGGVTERWATTTRAR